MGPKTTSLVTRLLRSWPGTEKIRETFCNSDDFIEGHRLGGYHAAHFILLRKYDGGSRGSVVLA